MRGMSEINKAYAPNNVIELKPKKIFDYEGIIELLPIVLRITRQYSDRVAKLISKLELIRGQDQNVSVVEAEINSLIQEWQVKVEKLGAITKGLWIADFDSGDGYFCWKFPEDRIMYWHGYRDGFSGRKPINEYLEKKYVRSRETTL